MVIKSSKFQLIDVKINLKDVSNLYASCGWNFFEVELYRKDLLIGGSRLLR